MKKAKSNSNIFKKIDIPPVLSSRNAESARMNSRPHTQGKLLQKSNETRIAKNTSTKILANQSRMPVIKSKENLNSSEVESLNSRIESAHLVNTLKSHIFRPAKELNLILRAIPNYTARKVQDLKKGYKFTEDFDCFATVFLSIFGVLDEELGKELVSIRRKIGEIFTAYLSNSGRFFKLLLNLPIILKKTEICSKVLNEALKMIGKVNRSKLSSNYQDLYEFLMLIINYLEKNNLTQKSQNSINNSTTHRQKSNKLPTNEFSMDIKDCFDNSYIYQTYDKCETNFNDSRIDTSFSDTYAHQTPHLNIPSLKIPAFLDIKSIKSSYDNTSKWSQSYEISKNHDPHRSFSSKILPMKMDYSRSRCKTQQKSSSEADKMILRNKISIAKRREWDEIRLVIYK